MASIIKHGFLFVLVVLAGTLGFALIASAAPGRQSAINNPAQRGTTRSAWQASLPRSERGPQLAPPKAGSAIPPIGSQSEIGNRKSAIPLSVPFIQNQGQIADPQVLFYARTFGGTVYVTAEGEIIYALPKAEAVSGQRSEVSRTAVIRETLVDADLTALPTGAERSGAVINSFIGNDPCRWKANIPSFTGVQFGDIYEGVALEVRATGDNVEKIFTVAPGADPARIALRLAGAEDVRITPAGELEARTALGPVRFTAPVAYQRGAAGERQSVSVAYALEGDQVGFCVGAFDAARPLVIDPLLASTFIGGSSSNVISAMALDSQTNVLVAGYTASTDFPTTNSYDTNSYNGGSYDGFIAKFDPQLTNLLAATYLGGVDEDKIMAMAINSNNGYVYVAGYTASTNFPITNALYDTYRGGDYDAFVSVLNSNLTTLTASTYLGGTNVDMAYALALRAGPTQDVFVAGLTSSTNFPIANTFGTTSFQTNLSGSVRSNDAFVIRFNTNLSANLASTYLGGTNDDGAYGIALDTNNFVYVAGYTTSTNFPMTNGAVRTYCGGVRDVFVARLSIALTNLNASTFLGGTSNEVANGIAVAPFTNIVCVVGYTTSTNYPQNPTNNVLATGYTNRLMGGKDAFLTRLDLALTNILASTYLGGTDDDEATAVLAAASTNSLRIYVAGWTTSSNFPVTANAYDTTANGGRDAFISYFGTGDTLQASTYLGGATNDSAYAMALQADSFSLFVAGATASTNFPATLRAYDNDRTGQTNDYGFVTKLGSGLAYGSLKWQVALTNMAGSPSLGWDGTVYCGAGSNLYAFDAQGRQRWKCSATGLLVNSALDDVTGLGCTPAIATNGTIYITTDSGALQAISPTGGVNWTFSGSGKAFESSPAIGSNGTIYFGTLSSKIYAVRDDGTNGVGLWTNTLASSVYASLAIASNGTIIAASANAAWLYILNQTNGNEIQSWSMPNVTYSASPAIGPDGRIYIGNGNELLCFDPTNPGSTQAWATAGPVYVAPTIGSNGMIYVGGGSNLYEFYPDGTTGKVWVTDGAIKSSPAIDSGGFIVVGSYTNGLCSFNPNGTTNWVLPCNEYVFYNSPLIQRDGTIYMTDEKYLYAIFGPAPTARTNWPTARHDVLRTGNAAFDAARILKPTGLTASPTGDYLNVSWSGDPNADYYELWRGTNEPGTNALINTLLTTNCVDTNISPGMIYYYGVRVATPVAMSDFSDSSSSGVPPLPPTNVIASQGNPTNEIVITWNASSNANMYYLWHSQTNATNTAVLLTTTNITGFTNTTFTRGLTYYYWVKAGNGAAGISDFSVGTNGGTPPQCPTNITASTNYFPAVAVAWNASDYATNYAVYRNTSNGIPAGFNYLAVTNGTNYNDVNSTPFQVYYYWIRATNEYGMSEFSVSTNGYRLLPPPQAVTASKGDYHTKIIVSWSNESAATSYLIYRNVTNDSATASNLYETASTNYYDLIIERGIGYYYWVRSKNAYGISADFSDPDIGGTVPPVPLNVNATDGTDENQVIVTWNAATNATGYEVYRQDSYTPWSLTTPLGIEYGTTYSDTQARPGLRYYYWIQATNQFGPIGPSELSGFDTGYCPLTPPSAISASDGVSVEHLYVTWSVSDNASNYELWRGTNSDRAAALMLVNDVATNAYDDTDSVQGVMYYYWVKAKTTQFVSDFSPYDSGYRALREVDIGVSDLVFLPTCMAVDGAPAAVSFRVTNYGVQNMAEPNTWVAYNFYISSNSVFGDTDDKWMGGTNVSLPLAVGNSAVVVLPKAGRDALAVPTVLPGWYYIFVNIQHAAPTKWLDPNLANNTTNRNGGVIRIGASQPVGLLL
ncbi:MAG: PQQ-binding-like beta-propeller repeat protein, partial [Verrucomicrobia bacterium]|nr:PQQ-binding-like beta-propeller repeat protein [Verrucomicrobiota bacterium]